MIDLHSHILTGLDDGAETLAVSLEMARMAVADGITHMACTPHILPGRYPNSYATIHPAIASLKAVLKQNQIPLTLVAGADVHVAWDLDVRLISGEIPTLNGSRYFLLEPPHQFSPPWLEILTRRLFEAGFVPIITHPERLGWVTRHFDVIERLHAMGCPLQLTADSLLGRFGARAKAAAMQILKEDMRCFVASDAHGATWRTPEMSRAMQMVTVCLGEEAADSMFVTIPQTILRNEKLPSRRGKRSPRPARGTKQGGFGKFVGLFRGEQ